MGKRIRGSARKAPCAEESLVDDGIHPGKRVLDQREFGDLRQIINTLVHTVTKHIPGAQGARCTK
jgi:hypothetical protein